MLLHYKVTVPTQMQHFISLPSYKRCDSLSNYEYSFTKDFYPTYYNLFPYLLRENAPNAKKTRIPGNKIVGCNNRC